MLAGVVVQELSGQFEIKNFEATSNVKSAAKENAGQVEVHSGPWLGSAGPHFRLIVDWTGKVDEMSTCGSRKTIVPDLESQLGVSLSVAAEGAQAYYVKFEAEFINADTSKNKKAAFPYFRQMLRGTKRGWSSIQANGLLKLGDVFDPKKGWLHAGGLRVSGKVTVAIDDKTITPDHSDEPNPVEDLSKDLAAAFAAGMHTDVTIKAKGEQIQAHSFVLRSRSSVFAAMLSSPMCEGTERVIAVDDLDMTVVKAAIGFLYDGRIDAQIMESDDMALGLLQVGHRYDVPSLVNHSVKALARRFDVGTVSEWFYLADLIGNIEFRSRCVEFIREHVSEVQGTENFEQFVLKRPALLNDILASLFPPTKRQRTEDA